MNRQEWEDQVWSCPNMNPTAVAVCIAIGSHGNWTADRTVRPSKQRIAGMVGTSRDTVAKYIKALEEHGWLKVVRVHKNNVKEYELSTPQVAVDTGILAIKNRGRSPKQVAVDESLGCRNSPVQVAVVNGQVASIYDTNLKNLQEEPTKEPITTTSAKASVVNKTDERLGEVAMFSRGKQLQSYVEWASHTTLTPEQRKAVRDLCMNPEWNVEESRPNHRTQAAILEVIENA